MLHVLRDCETEIDPILNILYVFFLWGVMGWGFGWEEDVPNFTFLVHVWAFLTYFGTIIYKYYTFMKYLFISTLFLSF